MIKHLPLLLYKIYIVDCNTNPTCLIKHFKQNMTSDIQEFGAVITVKKIFIQFAKCYDFQSSAKHAVGGVSV